MSARKPAQSNRQPILRDERDANRYVSRIVPLILLGIIVYASYSITKPLCSKHYLAIDLETIHIFNTVCYSVDYLINPRSHYDLKPRLGAGVAIIVLFYLLLFPVIATYLRLYYVVSFSPDFLPRGVSWTGSEPDFETRYARIRRKGAKLREGRHKNREKRVPSPAEAVDIERQAGGAAFPLTDFAQESFWTKDVFICQDDGRPAYCSKCCQFKTDRSHHNRDADRCVRKLDHFCPWYLNFSLLKQGYKHD